jgi:cob(I)alamin adenosyltransferase
MIYNFHGENKGKTSTALGTIVRALGHGKAVRVVFFMKHWKTSETDFFEKLQRIPATPFDISFYKAGDDDFIFKGNTDITLDEAKRKLQFGRIDEKDEDDLKRAQMGYMKALSYIKEKPFLVVLDEILYAVEFSLVGVQQVRHLIDTANEHEVHLVITGKQSPEEITKHSDLATLMVKIKHPFDKGIYAVKGLDY